MKLKIKHRPFLLFNVFVCFTHAQIHVGQPDRAAAEQYLRQHANAVGTVRNASFIKFFIDSPFELIEYVYKPTLNVIICFNFLPLLGAPAAAHVTVTIDVVNRFADFNQQNSFRHGGESKEP